MQYQSGDSADEDASIMEQAKKVRRRLASIYVDEPKNEEPLVFSYHYKYEKYLRDRNLIDPDKAKQLEEKLKRKQQLLEKKQNEAKAKGGEAPAALDGEDLSLLDEEGSFPATAGRFRFDNLIKTLIARIEISNTLAPV
mmetsp:Transcript_32971/g.50438  ORF Transcript_32971/g.50438 Transcript_32971/m.50438 type:complete len:139 (-) Transcript_32971:1373-1789(-)